MIRLLTVRGQSVCQIYQRLETTGKPEKLALTVAMRKLATRLKHLIKNPDYKLTERPLPTRMALSSRLSQKPRFLNRYGKRKAQVIS